MICIALMFVSFVLGYLLHALLSAAAGRGAI
jgi:hypothetical protein